MIGRERGAVKRVVSSAAQEGPPMALPRKAVLALAAAVLTTAGLAASAVAQIAVEKDYWVFSWDGTTLKDTGQRVKVNGGPAAIRTVEK